MLFKSLAIFALLGAGQAKPTPITLQHDDVLAFRDDGTPVVMKEWDYQIEQDKREVQRRKSGKVVSRAPAPSKRTKRACEQSTEVQVLNQTDFINWDVAMSPVIGNTGSSSAMVSVAQGYSVANSISVSGLSDPSPPPIPNQGPSKPPLPPPPTYE